MNAGQGSMTNAPRNVGDTTTGLVRYAGMAKGNASTQQATPEAAPVPVKVRKVDGSKVRADVDGVTVTIAGTKGYREYVTMSAVTSETAPAYGKVARVIREAGVRSLRELFVQYMASIGAPLPVKGGGKGASVAEETFTA